MEILAYKSCLTDEGHDRDSELYSEQKRSQKMLRILVHGPTIQLQIFRAR